MLILVAVTISMVVHGGLFEYAGKASLETNTKVAEERDYTNVQSGKTTDELIDYYTTWGQDVVRYDVTEIVQGLPSYSESLLDTNNNNVLTANAKYTDGVNTAPIPKGFKVSSVATENKVANGLVIQDAVGNEFVWIPVKAGEFTRTAWFANEPTNKASAAVCLEGLTDEEKEMLIVNSYGYNDKATFLQDKNVNSVLEYVSSINSNWTTLDQCLTDSYSGISNYFESSTNDPTGNYNNMVTSVENYGGFYIARYEAGYFSETQRTSSTTTTNTVVFQKGAYPYNYVKWGDDFSTVGTVGAVALCTGMYSDNDKVTSTLCYGVQWDATLRFIKDKVNVTESTNWGNFNNHNFSYTGRYASNGYTWNDNNATKPGGSMYLLQTGASEVNKEKNIYDFAGNVWEWTMEAYSSSYRTARGGSYCDNGYIYPAANHNACRVTLSEYLFGFRATLYL